MYKVLAVIALICVQQGLTQPITTEGNASKHLQVAPVGLDYAEISPALLGDGNEATRTVRHVVIGGGGLGYGTPIYQRPIGVPITTYSSTLTAVPTSYGYGGYSGYGGYAGYGGYGSGLGFNTYQRPYHSGGLGTVIIG